MSEIATIIDKLLKEPIAHHLCDSGGAYGYIYERNQTEGYLKGLNPVDEWSSDKTQERNLEITIPVFDFLKYNLEKDEETIELEQALFKEFKDNGFEPYEIYEVSDWLKSTDWIKETWATRLEYTNTYNYEEYLSQTLLYICFSYNGDDYVLLEVHNGCDVRSGYTYPQLFKLKDIEYFLIGQSDRFCQCECGLNDYTIYGSDDPTDSTGDYIGEDEIYKRTYVDDDGNVRCKECEDIIKGGFIEW